MKKLFVLSMIVLSIVFFAPSFANIAQASTIATPENSATQAEIAPAKKVVMIHLVYTVGSSVWSAREITDAYNRATLAVNYWNTQAVPVQFKIADTAVAAIGFDSLNIERASNLADSLNNAAVTVYLVRDPWSWYAYGFSRPGKYAVVAYTGIMSGVLAHELGHVLGATDQYYWNGFTWGCKTQTDIMCKASLVATPNAQTLGEINGFGW
jgi:hypothetical protein